jgi:hypothetical protein
MKQMADGVYLSRQDLVELANWIRGEDVLIHNTNSLNRMVSEINRKEGRNLGICNISTIEKRLGRARDSNIAGFFDCLIRILEGEVSQFCNVSGEVSGDAVGTLPHKANSCVEAT